jgi:hypothetical protein
LVEHTERCDLQQRHEESEEQRETERLTQAFRLVLLRIEGGFQPLVRAFGEVGLKRHIPLQSHRQGVARDPSSLSKCLVISVLTMVGVIVASGNQLVPSERVVEEDCT